MRNWKLWMGWTLSTVVSLVGVADIAIASGDSTCAYLIVAADGSGGLPHLRLSSCDTSQECGAAATCKKGVVMHNGSAWEICYCPGSLPSCYKGFRPTAPGGTTGVGTCIRRTCGGPCLNEWLPDLWCDCITP